MEMIVLQIITILIAAFLLFYAQQKGKNLAEKSDIGKITEIVEDIKTENAREIELLKANLALLNDKEKLIFYEEKESIILFFSQLNTWIWDSLNIYMHEYNPTNFSDISQKLIIMRDSYSKTNVAFSKVRLIVNNDELTKAGLEAITKTLDLHHFREGLLKRLSTNLSFGKVFVDQMIKDSSGMKNELRDFYIGQAKESDDEKQAIMDEYFGRNMEKFNPANDAVNAFMVLAKKYLRDN